MTSQACAPTLAEVMAVLDRAYPPHLAESWDSVGLVCGDPAERVDTVVVAVDATEAVVDDALDRGADLLLVHHPLLLRGVDTVGAHTPKGALIHRLIRGGCALLTAHTNADAAVPGVSDALAAALGVRDLRPLAPRTESADKWGVYVPIADADAVRAAMFAAGAGRIGNYSDVSFSVDGTGRFRPGDGAAPVIGAVGVDEAVPETRVEMIAPQRLREGIARAIVAAHPYEEVAFDVVETAPLHTGEGIGRVGTLDEPTTIEEFTAVVAAALPPTVWGVRAAGDPAARVHTVAVSGGSGDGYLGAATRAGADVFVSSDMRHHVIDEHLRAGGVPVIDVAHYAGEYPWCGQASALLMAEFGNRAGFSCAVTDLRTDPWSIGSPPVRLAP